MKKYNAAVIVILAALFCLAAEFSHAQKAEYLSDSLTEVGPLKAGNKIIVAGFYFEDGSAAINANLRKYVQKIAEQIKKAKYDKIFVDGYTDNKGDNSANNKISRERANGVRAELIKSGIPAKKIQARAYGSAKPLAPNNTLAGRIQNRRIEILIR